jgi:hypothetical protein
MIADFAIAAAFALLFSKIAPLTSRHKIGRFALLFVLCIPLTVLVNYIDVRAFGYHKLSWTAVFIIVLPPAAWGTFLPSQSQSHKQSSPWN